MILFSQRLIKIGVQALACKNLTFLFAKVWTPFFFGVKVDQKVAYPMPLMSQGQDI